MDAHSQHVTVLLTELTRGKEDAAQKLIPVYDELRRLARGYMGRERTEHTLQANALVHEAGLKLVELRFFGSLTVEQSAELRGISEKTVQHDWSVANAWLHGDLKADYGHSSGEMGSG